MNIRKRNKNHANKNTIYSRQFDFETTLIKFRILQLLSYNILCILYTLCVSFLFIISILMEKERLSHHVKILKIALTVYG